MRNIVKSSRRLDDGSVVLSYEGRLADFEIVVDEIDETFARGLDLRLSHSRGRPRVLIWGARKMSLARMILESETGESDPEFFARHLDDDPFNMRRSNLAWSKAPRGKPVRKSPEGPFYAKVGSRPMVFATREDKLAALEAHAAGADEWTLAETKRRRSTRVPAIKSVAPWATWLRCRSAELHESLAALRQERPRERWEDPDLLAAISRSFSDPAPESRWMLARLLGDWMDARTNAEPHSGGNDRRVEALLKGVVFRDPFEGPPPTAYFASEPMSPAYPALSQAPARFSDGCGVE